jgi:hypothetical protein
MSMAYRSLTCHKRGEKEADSLKDEEEEEEKNDDFFFFSNL